METVSQATIIAQCTPQGSGALALLRISGPHAFVIGDKISQFDDKTKRLSTVPSHTIHYGLVKDKNDAALDQVLFLVMRAPQTFTGEDTLEITCHNNPFIISALIENALAHGARTAMPGEFAQQAVMNNKIDVLQAEAINELIHANTHHALQQSLSQLRGSLSQSVSVIEQKLMTALAFTQASFEFLDEENMSFDNQISALLQEVRSFIADLQSSFNQQKQVREGIRIALIGSVNAGKSSLFNALLGQDRAIVTNIAGTTRDSIESGIYKNGTYLTIVDTAGIRSTQDTIEQIGIERSYTEAQKADIVLLIFDQSQPCTPEETKIYHAMRTTYADKVIIIGNKADLAQHNDMIARTEYIPVSTMSGKGIDIVNMRITEKVESLFARMNLPFLLNKRHYNALITLDQTLATIEEIMQHKGNYELIAYHLQDALATLLDLTGKTISEESMDLVFRQFCVGK